MTTESDLDHLVTRAAALASRLTDLGAKLADAARGLHEHGAPPADALVDELAVARDEFTELGADVVSLAEDAGVVAPSELASVQSFEPVIAAIAAARAEQRRRAALEQARAAVVAILERVTRIVHNDDASFPPLQDCHARATQLEAAVATLSDPAEAERLTDQVRAFADLLTMVDPPGDVDDASYAQLEDSVQRAFGRPLAVAAARGRLYIPGETPQPAALVETPPASVPEVEPIAVLDEQSAPVLDEEPAPVLEEQPASFPEEEPSEPLLEEQPALLSEKEPAELLLEEPAELFVEEQPAPLREEHTAPVLEEEPGPVPPSSAPEWIMPEPGPVDVADSADSPLAFDTAPAPVEVAPPSAPVEEPVSAGQRAGASAPPDETANWWLSAWARWSGWKGSRAFGDAAREELTKYPYLLSVPIRESVSYEEGLAAYGYSILLDWVERQRPGSVGDALNALQAGGRSVGDQLYDYMIDAGSLRSTYAEFVRDALVNVLPQPGVWVVVRIVDTKDDTRIFRRPSSDIGDSGQTAQRFTADAKRFAQHTFAMTLPPLTTRFVSLTFEMREARAVDARVTADGAPSDAAWLVTVPGGTTGGGVQAQRTAIEPTTVSGLGRDASALWVAVFNPDPVRSRAYELSLTLRKQTRTPFANRGRGGRS